MEGAPPTLAFGQDLDVERRLVDLRAWTAEGQAEDRRLCQQLDGLNPLRRSDVLVGSQIGSLRRQVALRVAQQPIFLDPEAVRSAGFTTLRTHLAPQYARLGAADRQLWLSNLAFLLTPTLRALTDKLDALRHYRSLGQARCLLLGGVSGTGKSSVLNWYTRQARPTVEATCNHVPVIKIDAPVSNRTPKPLFQRMLLACGAAPPRGDEEYHLQVLELFIQRCGVELLVVDEVEHMTQPGLRRRLLELSNLTGVPIVCASCNPVAWTIGDAEIQGRWNDYFALTQLTGPRLDAFLSLLDLLLPFDADSHLGVRQLLGAPGLSAASGPAHYVEEWTDGILREIMVLLLDACRKALDAHLPCLTVDLLHQAWRDVKRAKVVNFRDPVRLPGGGDHA
jgi:hypothetical protein